MILALLAPTAGHIFIGLPSGNSYVADANAVVIPQACDQLTLLGMGCQFTFLDDQGDPMSYVPNTVTYTPVTITGTVPTLTQANDLIKVNKTTGSATAIQLPAMTVDHDYVVQDAKGDAATNNITVTTANGDGKINGQTSMVINVANESLTFRFDGTTTTVN